MVQAKPRPPPDRAISRTVPARGGPGPGVDPGKVDLGGRPPGVEVGPGDQPVAVGAGVDPVAGQGEAGFLGPGQGEEVEGGAVDLGNGPAFGPLREQPVGVAAEHAVVAVEGMRRPVFRRPQRPQLGPDRPGVEGRGGPHDHDGPGLPGLADDRGHPVAEAGESVLAERVVDPVVHPVAGQQVVGFGHRQGPAQPLVDVGPGERVVGLRGPRHGLAGQAEVDQLELARGEPGEEVGVEVMDEEPLLGDAVAQEDDPLAIPEREVGPGGGRSAADQREGRQGGEGPGTGHGGVLLRDRGGVPSPRV